MIQNCIVYIGRVRGKRYSLSGRLISTGVQCLSDGKSHHEVEHRVPGNKYVHIVNFCGVHVEGQSVIHDAGGEHLRCASTSVWVMPCLSVLKLCDVDWVPEHVLLTLVFLACLA